MLIRIEKVPSYLMNRSSVWGAYLNAKMDGTGSTSVILQMEHTLIRWNLIRLHSFERGGHLVATIKGHNPKRTTWRDFPEFNVNVFRMMLR